MANSGILRFGDPDNSGVDASWLQVASTRLEGGDGKAVVTLSALAVAGAVVPPVAIPALVVQGQGLVGADGRLVQGLPLLALVADGSAGVVAQGVVALPLLQVEGEVNGARLQLPSLVLAAQGQVGQVGQGGARLLALDGSASLLSQGLGQAALTLPGLALDAIGQQQNRGQGALPWLPLTVKGAADAGQVATAALVLPLLTSRGSAYQDNAAVAVLTLPLVNLDSGAVQTLVAPGFHAVVVNTHTGAITTYSATPFDSLAYVGDILLAATDDGLYVLTGDSDAGAPIAAVMAGGISDLDSPQQKRLVAAYVGYRATGELELSLISDERSEARYRLVPRQQGELHAARVKLGRGDKGRYWQWRLANVGGADFDLNALTLDGLPLSRRV